MLESEMNDLIADCNDRVNAAYQFCYPVRDAALQRQAAADLDAYLEVLGRAKADCQAAQRSDAANVALGMHCFALSVRCFLQMWIELRDDDPGSAWDSLVNSQVNARMAMRISQSFAEQLEGLVRRLDAVEQVVFPAIQFVSPSMVVSGTKCSLCNAAFHECSHVSGLAYNGEFCVEVVDGIKSVDHIALVEHPRDKRCRLTECFERGHVLDAFTLRRTDRSDAISEDGLPRLTAIVLHAD